MLKINAIAPRNPINDAAAPPADGPATGADPAGFASLLRQTRAAPLPAVAAPAAPPMTSADARPDNSGTAPASSEGEPAAASQESPEPPESDPTRPTRALLKAKLRAADGAGPTLRSSGATASRAGAKAGASEAGAADKRADAPSPGSPGTAPALDPGVLHWLANLQRSTVADASAAKGGKDDQPAMDDGAAQAAALGDESGARPHGRPARPGAAELSADTGPIDQAAQDRARLADASSAGLFAQALAEQHPTEKPPVQTASAVGGPKDGAAPGAVSLAPTPGAAAGIAAPAAVVVATTVSAPDFAQELGLKLSVLARDGVQHAELHLNPAEMGPVSVQIVMDGTQARVDFGADMAATRQAIEAGLPELASALRDAGFTLAGGGVSQHAGGRGDGGDSGARGAAGRVASAGVGADADAAQRVGAAARRIVTAGGVDLYA